MSIADAESWMLCAERLLPHLKQDVIEAFMERMQSFQDRLATKPNVEACINDRVFNKALVKKNVLSWPGRNAFSIAVLSLQKTMINAQAQYQTYRLNPPLSENKQLSEHFTAGADMFQSGREVVRLIAAASIVLEGPDDKSGASAQGVGEEVSFARGVAACAGEHTGHCETTSMQKSSAKCGTRHCRYTDSKQRNCRT